MNPTNMYRSICAAGVLTAIYIIGSAACNFVLQSRLDEAVAQLNHTRDPYDAALELDAALIGLQKTCAWAWCSDELATAVEDVLFNRDSLLMSALVRGDERAIELTFDERRSSIHILKKARMLLPALAQLPNATPETLRMAGEMYAQGTYVGVDYKRAYALFSQAWKAGNTKAAVNLAQLFWAMNDSPNTYLWSLRCNDQCRVLQNTARSTLEGSQILRIQAMARFDKILTTGSTPLSNPSDMEASK